MIKHWIKQDDWCFQFFVAKFGFVYILWLEWKSGKFCVSLRHRVLPDNRPATASRSLPVLLALCSGVMVYHVDICLLPDILYAGN